MERSKFTGSFLDQDPLPEKAIATAVATLQSGRLHRYTIGNGEVAALEQDFAAFVGLPYALAVGSGGLSIQIALRAWGVNAGDVVLTNAFTLSPVPGAILAVGGRPELVDTTDQLRVDLNDLERKITATKARVFLLSHMRGHICDMDQLQQLLDRTGVALIEDCAHTMGARWDGQASGTFGAGGCWSTQTYKHINSGEGGLFATADPDMMARAIILSGSYMLYDRHGTPPPPSAFARAKFDCPNMSCRMDNLRAAVLRPQLANLNVQVNRWNENWTTLAQCLKNCTAVHIPARDPREFFVGSSLQFFLKDGTDDSCQQFQTACAERGVDLKWFGAREPSGYTITHRHWNYLGAQKLPQTETVLATLFDLRLPLTFDQADCDLLGEIIADEAEKIAGRT